jgi:hypothetical protein
MIHTLIHIILRSILEFYKYGTQPIVEDTEESGEAGEAGEGWKRLDRYQV